VQIVNVPDYGPAEIRDEASSPIYENGRTGEDYQIHNSCRGLRSFSIGITHPVLTEHARCSIEISFFSLFKNRIVEEPDRQNLMRPTISPIRKVPVQLAKLAAPRLSSIVPYLRPEVSDGDQCWAVEKSSPDLDLEGGGIEIRAQTD